MSELKRIYISNIKKNPLTAQQCKGSRNVYERDKFLLKFAHYFVYNTKGIKKSLAFAL